MTFKSSQILSGTVRSDSKIHVGQLPSQEQDSIYLATMAS